MGPDRGYFEFGARRWLLHLTNSGGARSSGNKHKSPAAIQTPHAPMHPEFSRARQRKRAYYIAGAEHAAESVSIGG